MMEDYAVNKSFKSAYGSYSIVNLTKKGNEFLADESRSFKLFETAELKAFNSPKLSVSGYSRPLTSGGVHTMPS